MTKLQAFEVEVIKRFEEEFLTDLEYHNLHTGLKMTYLDCLTFISLALHNQIKTVRGMIEDLRPHYKTLTIVNKSDVIDEILASLPEETKEIRP